MDESAFEKKPSSTCPGCGFETNWIGEQGLCGRCEETLDGRDIEEVVPPDSFERGSEMWWVGEWRVCQRCEEILDEWKVGERISSTCPACGFEMRWMGSRFLCLRCEYVLDAQEDEEAILSDSPGCGWDDGGPRGAERGECADGIEDGMDVSDFKRV